MHKLLQGKREQEFSWKNSQEELDRIQAVQQRRSYSFLEHVKIQDQQGEVLQESMFSCDRLWKSESVFSNIQFGYNPNRKRTFLYGQVKSSRYDSISQKNSQTLKEYQRNSTALAGKRAFSSRQRKEWTVLVENTYLRPWKEETIYKHFGRVNEDALWKIFPFLSKSVDRKK